MALYVIFPTLLYLKRRSAFLEISFALFLIIFLIHLFFENQFVTETIRILRGIVPFLFGMLLFKHAKAPNMNPKTLDAMMTVSLIILCATMTTGAPQLLSLVFVYTTVFLAVLGDRRSKATGWSAGVAPLGQLTYSIYMWHYLLITVFINALADKILRLSSGPMMVMVLLTYTLIFVISYWSWRFFETPARRAIDRVTIIGRLRLRNDKSYDNAPNP